MDDLLVLALAFVGAFLGSLVAHVLPDALQGLRERARLKQVLPPQTFREQWGRNVPAYFWKRHGPHRRRRG